MKRTTDLDELRQGVAFTWGEFVKIHTVGDFDVVEYHPHLYKDNICTYKTDDTLQFHCYMKGEDLSYSAGSLEEALAICIARKYDGLNSRAAFYFMKMIGAYDKKEVE